MGFERRGGWDLKDENDKILETRRKRLERREGEDVREEKDGA
jgi:hypothetical protein